MLLILAPRMANHWILGFTVCPFPAGLKSLKRLSLTFNRITDASLVHLKGT